MISSEALEAVQKLRTDFPFYARCALSIRTKTLGVQPFALNRTQMHLHERLEAQIATRGFVRAIVLKGRQQGVSTYTEGRYFHKTVSTPGLRTFILTHEDSATANLFEMVSRFYEGLPPELKPHAETANAKELLFDGLDSGYKVGTAGNKAVGRSSTLQLFHGSEVAFWPNAEEHAAGVLQAVPLAQGTEVVLESTANGLGNYYHEQWCKAERGDSDFEAIFLPWYWQEEYVADAANFVPDPDEIEYQNAYQLTREQMAWRRKKIAELGVIKFRQEYPGNAQEAFQSSGENALIQPEVVLRARKTTQDPTGPLVIGVDPARFGDDRTAIIRRRTRCAYGLETHRNKDNMELVAMLAKIIRNESPRKVFIDIGGGAGVVDRLRELGYEKIVEPVNFGELANDQEKYRNRRAEMWWSMKEWLEDIPAAVPDSDSLHADICAPMYRYDSNERRILESKEDMKKRLRRSPDEGDALALTFALPVSEYGEAQEDPYQYWRQRRFA